MNLKLTIKSQSFSWKYRFSRFLSSSYIKLNRYKLGQLNQVQKYFTRWINIIPVFPIQLSLLDFL